MCTYIYEYTYRCVLFYIWNIDYDWIAYDTVYSDNMDDNHVHVLSKNTLIATLAHDMHLKAAQWHQKWIPHTHR